MEVEFEDSDLERILYEASFTGRYPDNVVKMFRRRMQFIFHAQDERDIRAMKSLHFEALKGQLQGQHSIRLNRQYRIVFRLDGEKEDKKVVVLAIEDYHQ